MFSKQGMLGSLSVIALAIAGAGSASAQSADGAEDVDIVVTGSFISRDNVDAPVPLLMVEREDIERSGANTISDLARNLSINTGSQFNTDERTQGGTTGSSNFNLRGLGVGSTLVLQDGRRRPNATYLTNEGVNFVDINAMMPTLMIERIEVLKDGAASLYGSDAVAGVVNFISRDNFEGFELSSAVRVADDWDATRDIEGGAIWGWQKPNFGVVLAANYLDRTIMTADELDFAARQNFTTLGNPGAFQPVIRPGAPTTPIENRPIVVVGGPAADVNCAANGGAVTASGASTLCGFFTDRFVTITAAEERLQVGGTARWDTSADSTLSLRMTYSDNDALRFAIPSFPLTALPYVPSTNPGFAGAPAAVLGPLAGISLPAAAEGALFYGRALPMSRRPTENRFESETTWLSADYDAALGDRWRYNVALTYAHIDTLVHVPDVLKDRFLAALSGRGGPNNNQFYNPFSSGLTAAPGSPLYNDPAVEADFSSAQVSTATADFWVADALLTGSVFQIGGRDVGAAIGVQWREDSRALDFNQESNDNRLFFLRGRPDAESVRGVWSAFGEMSWPLAETLEVQTALRWEDHGGSIGSSVDPKIAVLWTPDESINLRASFATAFRAPQSAQSEIDDAVTSLERVVDPHVATNSPFARASFYPVVRVGNPNLKAEQSQSYNIGVTARPDDGVTVRLDYWDFTVEDMIVGESAQSLVTANNPANVHRIVGVGSIEFVQGTYFNAATLETSGIDLEAIFDLDLGGAGDLRLDFTGTAILEYTLQERAGGPVVDRLGRRNFGTVASSTPDFRGNFAATWSIGPHTLTGIARYVSSYVNDEPALRSPALPEQTIDSWTTFDVQYQLSLEGLVGEATTLTLGAVNVTDQDPPFAATDNGLPYDSRVHDPRGRQIYVGIKQRF